MNLRAFFDAGGGAVPVTWCALGFCVGELGVTVATTDAPVGRGDDTPRFGEVVAASVKLAAKSTLDVCRPTVASRTSRVVGEP